MTPQNPSSWCAMLLSMELNEEEKKIIEFMREYGEWVSFEFERQNGKIVMMVAKEKFRIALQPK